MSIEGDIAVELDISSVIGTHSALQKQETSFISEFLNACYVFQLIVYTFLYFVVFKIFTYLYIFIKYNVNMSAELNSSSLSPTLSQGASKYFFPRPCKS